MPNEHPSRRPVRADTLAPGARVALVAPAGPLRNAAELERAVANVRSFGWEPHVGSNALARRGYLAGDDALRLADLNTSLANRDIDALWFLRGGYGSMRLLDSIDYDALRRRPKVLIGYSDVTAILLAIHARTGLVGYHGPTARAALSQFSRASLERAVTSALDPCGIAPEARVLRHGVAGGPLVGGNLSILTALIGTPFAARLRGAVLVLEDVNEKVYRVDRMLRQLRLCGLLASCSALVFGEFTGRGDDDDDSATALEEVLLDAASAVSGPVLAGVPVGHIEHQWTVPMGEFAAVNSDTRSVRVHREE